MPKCRFNKITFQRGYSPINLPHICRTRIPLYNTFYKNTSGGLLLPLEKLFWNHADYLGHSIQITAESNNLKRHLRFRLGKSKAEEGLVILLINRQNLITLHLLKASLFKR